MSLTPQHRALIAQHCDSVADVRGRWSVDFDEYGIAALIASVERAARAAAFDDVVAGIRAVQAAYDEQEGRPNVPGSVCSDCIGVVNALRARAEGDGEGGR